MPIQGTSNARHEGYEQPRRCQQQDKPHQQSDGARTFRYRIHRLMIPPPRHRRPAGPRSTRPGKEAARYHREAA
jgi:hypothetical protein